MNFMKNKLEKYIGKIKFILKDKIPSFLDRIVFNKKIIHEIEKCGLKDVKKFNEKNWHMSYRYYTAEYNNKTCFIKLSKNKSWIKHEFDIYNYIIKNKSKLNKMIPEIYDYIDCNYMGFIIEEFLFSKTLSKIDVKIFNEKEKKNIYFQLLRLVKELQKIKLIHMDLHNDNIYIDSKGNIYVTDFGFSIIKSDNINLNFIGNNHRINQIINSINEQSRLEKGYIDDANSILHIMKYIDKDLYTNNNEIWRKINDLTEILVFDYSEIRKQKYEN